MPAIIIHHKVNNGKFSQPEELRAEGKFLLKLYTTGGEKLLKFTIDGFLKHVVEEMNRRRFDRNRPPYTENDVRELFIKFIRHQKLDISDPVVQAMSSALRELVLSGVLLLGTEKDIEGNFKAKKPSPEDINKG
ncbi:MAG: hypothetical protein N3G76_00615 [Candidatus Micrarchaeota archaeon]|nr:hypothetical protein [Candidatus Micrarchaeota archaeon]